MNKLIKTENILSYLKQYCTNIPIDSYRDIECGSVTFFCIPFSITFS